VCVCGVSCGHKCMYRHVETCVSPRECANANVVCPRARAVALVNTFVCAFGCVCVHV